MGTTRVQLPDGNFGEFPATMKPEEIEAVLSKQFPPESAAPPVPKAPEPEGIRGEGTGLTGIDPHEMPHSMSDLGVEGLKAFSNIGAGGLGALSTLGRLTAVPDLLMGKPTIYEDAYHGMAHPVEAAKGMAKGVIEHPLETVEQGIGAAGAMGMVPEGANLLDKLPSKGRAINTLNEVSQAAKDVPVPMTMTDPAVQGFRDFVNTGGRNSRVMTKLGRRLDIGEPVNFPEARQFYSNVSEASARPGFLRRAIESPSAPKMRHQLGGVREAMANDLTESLEPIGMSDKYTEGIREYANNAKLRSVGGKIAKGAGAVATEEALRRTGLLGKMAAGAAKMSGQ